MNKNNFSYWFPKIKNCGIKVPDTMIFKVPEEIRKHFNRKIFLLSGQNPDLEKSDKYNL